MTITPPCTKADLRRAVIRTAARAHARHDRTGSRAIAAGLQDNDVWASEGDPISHITFARQEASAILQSVLSCSGGGATPCKPAPERTLPCEVHSPQRSAPAGAADPAINGLAASRSRTSVSRTDVAAAPALSSCSLHNGGNTDA